jgi:hypothetical protein
VYYRLFMEFTSSIALCTCLTGAVRMVNFVSVVTNMFSLLFYLISQAKNEVRKLFVNCCRVRPDRCLELLCAVMSSQPLPLSTGEPHSFSSAEIVVACVPRLCASVRGFPQSARYVGSLTQMTNSTDREPGYNCCALRRERHFAVLCLTLTGRAQGGAVVLWMN